jgi:hypothetical protein
MTIQYVLLGDVANDGTGDDLREAFVKVNNNFEELDGRIVEETLIINAGTVGQGIYLDKIDGEHIFKRLVPGSNITLSSTANSITINAANSLDQLIISTDGDTLTIVPGRTTAIKGGNGIVTSLNGQQIIVSLENQGIVEKDTLPKLSANLNANSKNIINVDVLQANTIQGQGGIPANYEGNVYGYDVRSFLSLYNDFDFGEFYPVYSTPIEFIIRNLDVDFGAFDPRKPDEVDFGSFV